MDVIFRRLMRITLERKNALVKKMISKMYSHIFGHTVKYRSLQ